MRRNWKTLKLAGVIAVLTLVLMGTLPVLAARQVHMENALRHLQSAKAELQQAGEHQGGHRVKAIRLIDDAIVEVREGIRAGERFQERATEPRHSRHVNLSDLIGMRARNLDSEMRSRGFINKGGYKQGDTSFTTWWNASAKQCVEVETKQGRVHQVKGIFEGNCL